MAIFNVKVESVSALLMHRWSENQEVDPNSGTRPIRRQDLEPRQDAELSAYRRENGELYMPGACIARLMREAGGAHKEKGSRKSIKYIVPAACIVLEDDITLLDLDNRPQTQFEVDSRPVVIPATKGRIMRHRPRINEWAMAFSIDVDQELIDPKIVHLLITQGGRRIGVGDYRPERGGPFGRFNVTGWAELERKPQPVVKTIPSIHRRKSAA